METQNYRWQKSKGETGWKKGTERQAPEIPRQVFNLFHWAQVQHWGQFARSTTVVTKQQGSTVAELVSSGSILWLYLRSWSALAPSSGSIFSYMGDKPSCSWQVSHWILARVIIVSSLGWECKPNLNPCLHTFHLTDLILTSCPSYMSPTAETSPACTIPEDGMQLPIKCWNSHIQKGHQQGDSEF